MLDSEIFCSYRDPGRIEPRRVPLSRALFSPARLTPWSPRFYARVSFKTLVWLVMTGGDRPSSSEALPRQVTRLRSEAREKISTGEGLVGRLGISQVDLPASKLYKVQHE